MVRMSNRPKDFKSSKRIPFKKEDLGAWLLFISTILALILIIYTCTSINENHILVRLFMKNFPSVTVDGAIYIVGLFIVLTPTFILGYIGDNFLKKY